MQLQKDNDLDCHWKNHLLDILHACKHHHQNHIWDSFNPRLSFLPLFLGFLFLHFGFFFLNTRECSCGLSLDSMSKIAEWLNKRLLTVFICLDSALHTCCQLCLLSFLTIFLFSGITPTKWFCLVLQVKLVWILQNQVNEIWGEGKKEFYTMIALFAFNKWSNELAKYNASS